MEQLNITKEGVEGRFDLKMVPICSGRKKVSHQMEIKCETSMLRLYLMVILLLILYGHDLLGDNHNPDLRCKNPSLATSY